MRLVAKLTLAFFLATCAVMFAHAWFVSSSALEQLEVNAALALVDGVLIVALGGVLVGAPLGRMVALARRVGDGDLSQRLGERGGDEIGMLARELDRMCDRLEEARRRAEEEYSARLQTLEQLRHLDRLHTVGLLASSVAHEIGTPLNVVLIRAQTLSRSAEPECAESGAIIAAQIEKMTRLVRQLLDYSRRGRARGRVSLGEIAKRVEVTLGSLARRAGAEVRVTVERPAFVMADAAEIEQTLTNLVMNAIQAKGGRIELVVGVDQSECGARSARVEVRDDGAGMTPDVLSRLFQPFFTTKPAGVGTGLGLTVASGIARDHGGELTAESAPGQGSTFRLRLPEAP